MASTIARNRRFLTDLFAGPFPGHGIIMDPQPVARPWPDDPALPDRPVADWVPWVVQTYEEQLEVHQALDDDRVPYVKIPTGTEIFAAAFGCPVHLFEDSNPAALPLVSTAAEADRLPQPDLNAPTLARIFELGHLVRERVGPEVPMGVPDIQSPFDIAALIWHKEDFFVALVEEPDAVMRLGGKCQRLLTEFLKEFQRQFPECNLCHCPYAWAPPELGCWLSEDEAGCLSVPMFERFCLPVLTQMSETFGGLFVHCCATADHQYASFRKIPRLRGLNRVFQAPGPRPAIDAFSGETVLMMAWVAEETVNQMLDMAHSNTRFLFNMPGQPLDEAKRTYERLRARCPRV